MSDLTERLAEALAVCDAATEGPWEADTYMTKSRRVIDMERGGFKIAPPKLYGSLSNIPTDGVYGEFDGHDAEFIAHARTGYPAALKALQVVLDMHWPAKYTGDTESGYEVGSEGDPCMECNLADREGLTPMVWPCPTFQAVAERLGATDE